MERFDTMLEAAEFAATLCTSRYVTTARTLTGCFCLTLYQMRICW